MNAPLPAMAVVPVDVSGEMGVPSGSTTAPAADAGDAGFADALLALLGAASADATKPAVATAAAADAAADADAAAGGAADASPCDPTLAGLAAVVPLALQPADLLALLGQRDSGKAASLLLRPDDATALATGPASGPAMAADTLAALFEASGDGARALALSQVNDVLLKAKDSVDAASASPEPRVESADGKPVTGFDALHAGRAPHDAATRALPAPIQAPLTSPQWAPELAARVSWIVERGDQTASIQLSPEDLGPVEVRVAIREGEASIWFGAAHPETRQAIEQAIPRLREMLSANGLSLADAGVFQQAPRDPQRGFVRADALRAAAEAGEPGQARIALRRQGLIDDYA